MLFREHVIVDGDDTTVVRKLREELQDWPDLDVPHVLTGG